MNFLAVFMSTVLALSCGVDDRFLAAVREHGINYASPEFAISAAHLVCADLDQGESPYDIAQQIMQNSNLDGFRAGFFVGVSEASYCPRYIDQP